VSKPAIPDRTSNSLTVQWSSVTLAGELYRLQYSSGSTTWYSLGLVNSPATYVHGGLQPDRKYCYRIQASSTNGIRTSPSACRYTIDASRDKVWRVELELRTADIDDADTDDSVSVSLNEAGTNHTWLDYARDDFERGTNYRYDVALEKLEYRSDINRIHIRKTGTDGWCVAGFGLFVNGVLAYDHSFASLPSGCHWIDGNDGHLPTFTVNHSTIRAQLAWQQFDQPQRFVLNLSQLPLVIAEVRVPRDETESRVESIIGDVIHGTELEWGQLYGDRYVEASYQGYGERVHVDLDLDKGSWWFDPEVDIDFDLRYQASCSEDQTEVIVNVTTANLDVNVDYDWFAEALSFVLPCGLVVSPITGEVVVDCISSLERHIEGKVRAAFQPISESFREAVPQGARCLDAEVQISPEANVTLAFTVQPPSTVTPVLPISPILPIVIRP
jgi:hypothetical protein